FRAKLQEGKNSISFELAHFLKVWLTRHIMESDRRYSPYFLEQGIKPELSKKSWTQKLWDSFGRK
ncbi:MAG: hemerythrin, partial [Candidatus Competibacteraceae bacterium]|nr:hemerythrin [Candidatus Competibacteraceae bacterium]